MYDRKRGWLLVAFVLIWCGIVRSQSLNPPESFTQEWLHDHEGKQGITPPIDIPNPRLDPAKIDILGFKLYMTGEEAKANAVGRFSATKKCVWGIGVKDILPCIEIDTGDSEYTPKAKFISRIQVRTEHVSLKMDFTETFPFDSKRPEQLTSLEYYPQGLQTEADRAAFSQMVLAKYGEPSAVAGFCARGWPLIGSDSSQVNYEDLSKTPLQLKGWQCDYPLLTLHGYAPEFGQKTVSGISLSDGFELARREQQLWESQRKAALPPL